MCRWYIKRREKIVKDNLFKSQFNYHRNIKLRIEISIDDFIETKLNCVYSTYKTMVHRKTTK